MSQKSIKNSKKTKKTAQKQLEICIQTQKRPKNSDFLTKINPKTIERAILREARALGLAVMAFEPIAKTVSDKIAHWANARGGVTRADIERQLKLELKKYSRDLEYWLENHDKII